ncbi:hypothetical protein EIP86_000092 [Pleurotus ostreatoroseus]|nr:hypothetical protein EIP86_000092 [Pleurotus ostreatoroseus]
MYQEEVKEQLYETIVHKRREWLPLPGPKRPLVRRFPMPGTPAEVISEIDEEVVNGIDEGLDPQEPEPEEPATPIPEPISMRSTAPERSIETLESVYKSGPSTPKHLIHQNSAFMGDTSAANTSEVSAPGSTPTDGSELPAWTPMTPITPGRGLRRHRARGESYFAENK